VTDTLPSWSKKRETDSQTSSSESQNTLHPDADNALKALGYLESDKFEAISSQVLSLSNISYQVSFLLISLKGVYQLTEQSPVWIPDEIREALRTIPARPYGDELVENFFHRVNYHYCILHQPSFMPSYRNWWSQRRLSQPPSSTIIVFTCIVLRICANSTQFLPLPLILKLESELGDSVEELSACYQRAAQKLSSFISPGTGGLEQVQQLFLGSTWLKAEADFVDSWHALGAAVREAQEIGACFAY
jgi:hypothetical protein